MKFELCRSALGYQSINMEKVRIRSPRAWTPLSIDKELMEVPLALFDLRDLGFPNRPAMMGKLSDFAASSQDGILTRVGNVCNRINRRTGILRRENKRCVEFI